MTPFGGSPQRARRWGSISRARAIPALLLICSVLVIAAIQVAVQHADENRRAQVRLAHAKTEVSELQLRPYGRPGVPMSRVSQEIDAAKAQISGELEQLQDESPASELQQVFGPLRVNFAMLDRILAFIEENGRLVNLDPTQTADFYALALTQRPTADALTTQLDKAGDQYESRASASRTRAAAGSAAAILLLALGFGLVYNRSVRARATAETLARENARLAADNGDEARTDALTGLRNRRALVEDLDDALVEAAAGGDHLVLGLFDLNGFKNYNDTFGHPAGDALLTRLGERLRVATSSQGTAYRIGGDEFCVIGPASRGPGASLVEVAAKALSESGDAFRIGCAYGTALLPDQARSPADALRLADQRMYEHKADRSSAGRQSSDVLLTVLGERSSELRDHLGDVADLAARTAHRLGLPDHEVKRVRLAAELHDVGKTAIPDAIFDKPGPLDESEWAFMRRHTVIGERIVLAAPSLAPCADLVRSSHERYDGGGYPDGLRGEAIPLGARIIAICDAYDAIIAHRPYRASRTASEAIAEVRRCAGSQFDPHIVEVFCALLDDPADDATRTDVTGRAHATTV